MEKFRILIADDNKAIHEDLHYILETDKSNDENEQDKLSSELFGGSSEKSRSSMPDIGIKYLIDDVFTGDDAVKKVIDAEKDSDPYSVVFMDSRMPPGIDGVEAIKKIWDHCPHTEIVMCTAYSDYSWKDILETLGRSDHLLFLRKPFDIVSVQQTVLSQVKKWDVERKYVSQIDNLESIVNIRTKELESMVAHLSDLKLRAEEATAAKSLFLSNVSHEIRTPLNGILGMADILLDSNLKETERDFIQTIKNSGVSLLSLVNDLLDYSKVEAGKLELENINFDISDVIDTALDLVTPIVAKRGVDIISYVDPAIPMVVGDPERLRQILLNLLNNAAKFTHEGRIAVNCSFIDVVDSYGIGDKIYLEFDVSDTGIGIPTEKQEAIFNTFEQADPSSTRKYGGTGLGLAICKKLVELMDGDISIESEVGKGSKFSFTVCMKSASSSANLSKIETKLEGKDSIIVAGSGLVSEVLAKYMASYGGNSKIFYSFENCIESIEECEIKGDCFVIVETLKFSRHVLKEFLTKIDAFVGSSVTKIALLDFENIDELEILREIGFDSFLRKPLKRNQFLRVLANENTTMNVTSSENRSDEDGLRALIVEDNPINRKMLAKMLNMLGFTAVVVENGKEAVDAAVNDNFDMIFMDLNMPLLDGIQATKIIREKYHIETPIIAISANVFPENKKACLSAGMTDFLGKPFLKKQLEELIRNYINI